MEREIFGGEICWSKICLKNEKEILQKRLNLLFLKAEFDSALKKKLHFPINFPSLNLLSTSSQPQSPSIFPQFSLRGGAGGGVPAQKLGPLRVGFLGGIWRSCRMRGGAEIV